MKQQIQAYLSFLAKADYQKLFEDTKESTVSFQDRFVNEEKKQLASIFIYGK